MSPNSFHLTKPHNSHCPFTSSCNTTDLSFTSSPMQTTNRPLITPLILTNHTPPTSAFYHLLNLHVNEGSQLYTFLNSLDHAQLKHFPVPTLLVLRVGHDHTPQPTPISSTCPQPPPKILCPTHGHQFTSWRLAHHQRSCQTFNSSNPNPCAHPSAIPYRIPTPYA
jgi:hypothetical protein